MLRSFPAPAKINLCLHVLGRRPDGYHELAMLMQRVSLFDRVTIDLETDSRTVVTCSGVELAVGEENIAARAARLLLDAAGQTWAVTIDIDKQIPLAAGLGGGSSDAAAVLTGLDAMLGLNLSRPQLMALGRRLGADVPFFIFASSAWATGIGDLLEAGPPLPEVWYLLVNPGIAVSTSWVYGNLGLTSPGDVARLREFPRTTGDLVRLLHNDLEQVTIGRFPLIAGIKRRLLELGAAGALMSGSGPTVFGVFDDESMARSALGVIQSESAWRVWLVEPVEGERSA